MLILHTKPCVYETNSEKICVSGHPQGTNGGIYDCGEQSGIMVDDVSDA